MAHSHPSYMESIVSVLGCTPDEYWSIYESPWETDEFAEDVTMNIIKNCETSLREENRRYRLDTFLYTMLHEAPHPTGKRYVAVALHIAYTTKGEAAVVELAKAWMYSLFLPIFALSRHLNSLDSGIDYSQEGSDEPPNNFKTLLAEREEHRCAITKMVDSKHLRSFILSGRSHEAPAGPRHAMEAAYIIPPVLMGRSSEQYSSRETTPPTPKPDAAIKTWDVFRAWTQIEASDLTAEILNSPANGVFMTVTDYDDFKEYLLYFDKDAYPESPHKYKVQVSSERIVLSNGATFADVEFRTLEESGVEPPNPLFLKVHGAFAKVLYRCGAAQYYHLLLHRSEEGPVQLDTEDGDALLTYRLCTLAL